MIASRNGDLEIVKLLSEKGADLNAKTAFGNTALIWASLEGRSNVLELLLE